MMQKWEAARSYGGRLWAWLEAELLLSNALLLPMRLFIGLGWLRAGVEKVMDPLWGSGDTLLGFFQAQLGAGRVYFPFYETLMTQVFAPQALALSWIVAVGELLAGIAIMAGVLTNLALLGGLFMNLNFVLAGVVNPSAFYILIQGTLLAANAGRTLGADRVLAGYLRSRVPGTPWGSGPGQAALPLLGGLACTGAATLVVPYIRDFGPHSIEDPAMLLFILSMLGAMLAGIQFVRATTVQGSSR